jgi:hypothetical protein
MKKTLCCLLTIIALGVFNLQAQTNAPVAPPINVFPISLDGLTNLPSASGFDTANFGLDAGVLVKSAGLENSLKLDAYWHTNWMGSVEILNAPSASVVDALALHFGYRKAWHSSELYGQVGARRTWSTTDAKPAFQGIGLVGASWVPVTGGTWWLSGEARLLTSPTGPTFNTKPQNEFVLFVARRF